MLVEYTWGNCNSNMVGGLERLITFTLSNYGHRFMGRLNAMDSRSRTRAHDVYFLFIKDTRV